MRLVSTVPAWSAVAAIGDVEERVAGWTEHYESAFPSVFEVYYSAWGDPARRAEAAVAAPGLVTGVRAAEGRATELVARAEADFRARALLADDELQVVLLVGGHTSNGWVADLDGQPTLFLALELLGRPPYDDLLVVHELAHVAQGRLSPATRARSFPTSLATVVEGAATATSRVLKPGLADSAYLWMDDAHDPWVAECGSMAGDVAALLDEHLDTLDDAAAVAPLLRNGRVGAVPPRAAYWVGDQIARELLDAGCDLRDLLAIGPDHARQLVAAWASRHAHD